MLADFPLITRDHLVMVSDKAGALPGADELRAVANLKP